MTMTQNNWHLLWQIPLTILLTPITIIYLIGLRLFKPDKFQELYIKGLCYINTGIPRNEGGEE